MKRGIRNMKTMRHWLGVTVVAALAAGTAHGQALRFANGAPVQGELARATEQGLEVTTARGPQTVPWEQLSAGTRYRHQPGFRDALPKILAGEAVVVAAAPAAPAAPPAGATADPAPAPAPAPGSGTSFTRVAQTPVPAPAPASPRAPPAAQAAGVFPAGTFKNVGKSLVFAIAFSDAPADTVYLGADIPEERNARPTDLLVWWPNRTPAEPPVTIHLGGGTPPAFPVIRWTGTREGHELDIELTISIKYSSGRLVPQALAYVNARRSSARIRYFMRHVDIKWAAGNKPLVTTRVFDTPAVRARFTEGGRRMLAMVKVGEWDILPLQGTETTLNVEAFDARGRSAEKGRVKTDEETVKAKSEAWEHEFKRMKGGETYTVKGLLNLGVLFGEATFEQSVPAVDLKF